MKKLLVAILLVSAMLALAACGVVGRTPNQPETQSEADTAPQAPEPIPEPPAAPSEEAAENIEPDAPAEEEFDDPYRSPRTATTGILADPQRAFAEITVYVNLGWSAELESLIWEERALSFEDAQMIHNALATMDATEILTPTHIESQQADTKHRITIRYEDGSVETAYSIWGSIGTFYRYTGTYGSSGDPGFVFGINEALFEFLMTYF